jgi:hypothetical protein
VAHAALADGREDLVAIGDDGAGGERGHGYETEPRVRSFALKQSFT